MVVDSVHGTVVKPATLVQNTYALDNPVGRVELTGMHATAAKIGETTIQVKPYEGKQYAKIRDLIAAYGGELKDYKIHDPYWRNDKDIYYPGTMGSMTLRFYVQRDGRPTRQLEFYTSNGTKYVTFQDNPQVPFVNFDGNNYIDVEYFHKFMCYYELTNLSLEWIDSSTTTTLNGGWDGNVELLTTVQVAAIQTARESKELLDLRSGEILNIS